MEELFGVYIGENIEVVITPKYTLVYRKNIINNSIDSYFVDTSNFRCIGVCRTEPIPTADCGFTEFKYFCETPQNIKYAMDMERTCLSNDEILSTFLNRRFFHVKHLGNEYEFTFEDGAFYRASIHENLSDHVLEPKYMDNNEYNIDECLQKWHLGVHEEWQDNHLVGIEVNTLKHMYNFCITRTFIYCRAARYITCKEGVVFNQNFRQNFHNESLDGEVSIYDNNTIAAEEIIYNKECFNPDVCAFNGVDIYWSVKSFEKDKVILNACDGGTYTWSKPVDSVK